MPDVTTSSPVYLDGTDEIDHSEMERDQLHEIGYIQADDPGAVGARKTWIDISGGTGNWLLKIRNAANDGWETLGGSTPSGDFTKWDPMAPPASPSSYDDEFDDASFDTALWDEFDNDSRLSIVEDQSGLHLDPTYYLNDIVGCMQDVPTGYFTMWTRLHVLGSYGSNSMKVGMMLLEDGANNPTTSDILTACLNFDTTGVGIMMEYWTDYATHSTTYYFQDEDIGYPPLTSIFMRIRYTSGLIDPQWHLDVSTDGLSWLYLNTEDAAFTPSEMGLFIKNVNSTNWEGIFPFFRVIEGEQSNPILITEGDRVDGFLAS